MRALPPSACQPLEDALFDDIASVLAKHPDFELCITGHSLGGALSLLLGVRLACARPELKIQVINVGCPKVGDLRFAALVRRTPNLRVHRFVNRRDIVARGLNLGYKHAGHTVVIDATPGVPVDAHKWHSGLSAWSNWSPLRGVVSDHHMDGPLSYIVALRKHSPSQSEHPEPWIRGYREQ